MEKTLFEWEGKGRDKNAMAFTFYGVTLLVPIGPFPVGWKCARAIINYDDGILKLMNGPGWWKFNLNLSVGEGNRIEE